jgi:hypothetical protein
MSALNERSCRPKLINGPAGCNKVNRAKGAALCCHGLDHDINKLYHLYLPLLQGGGGVFGYLLSGVSSCAISYANRNVLQTALTAFLYKPIMLSCANVNH